MNLDGFGVVVNLMTQISCESRVDKMEVGFMRNLRGEDFVGVL